MTNVDLTLSIQEIRSATGMSRHDATDLCKRFGFLCANSWHISESVLNRLLRTGKRNFMRLSPIEALPTETRWTDPNLYPPPDFEELIVLTADGEMKIMEYKKRNKLKSPVRYYMPKPDLPCPKEDLR